ncbi:MAG: hypothetical protein ABS76_13315 [Pelagibacterium sp. SCN 64-44]|nr:MAG: hypothetical protein ABS76_13315 [Pelagibacterium sp. SCN 64-44]
MRRRQIVYAPDARQDRVNITRWLTLRASAEVARRFDHRIRNAVHSLEYASERGTVRDDHLGLRIIGILPTVSIAFSVTEDAVIVHRILYLGQSWASGD